MCGLPIRGEAMHCQSLSGHRDGLLLVFAATQDCCQSKSLIFLIYTAKETPLKGIYPAMVLVCRAHGSGRRLAKLLMVVKQTNLPKTIRTARIQLLPDDGEPVKDRDVRRIAA